MLDVFDPREGKSADAREAGLMAALPALLQGAQSRAPGWARILADVDPRQISSRAALARLPVTRKSDLKALQDADPPFGGLTATAMTGMTRLFMSPGPVFDPQAGEADFFRVAPALHAAGIRSGDIVQNCFAYHFTPAAFMVEGGARALGCPVIPAGTGAAEQQLQVMRALRPVAYVGTPSFLRILIEKAAESGADIGHVKHALLAAEALPPSLRAWFKERGMRSVLQWYGTADLGCVAYETVMHGEVQPGMVLSEDLLLEIVVPGTGEVCAPGDVGEIVITSFNAHYPMIRFGTGDLSKLITAPKGHAWADGRTNQRIAGWMGRADQTTKVRGMFVHPGQIAQLAKRFGEIRRARLVVSGTLGQDAMLLRCETDTAHDGLAVQIGEAIRDITKLRGEVELVAPGSLPNDGKIIEDARSYQ
jgi:phenylacetate-CoA ligase